MPDLIAHKGASLSRAMSHQWLTTEGVFGVALGVSSGFIFLFVLFGSLLDRAGAGNYFIKSAFALLGHMRGGPAKAAVVSSAATGIISAASIANVVTTGTFTIPLMKRVGYRPDQAGAVEVSSSVNGQIMPPVMGAAAFLMVEYVGIPYSQVMKHAVLPAIISYIALFLHRAPGSAEGRPQGPAAAQPRHCAAALLVSLATTVVGFIVLSAAVYYGIGWVKTAAAGDGGVYVIGCGVCWRPTWADVGRFAPAGAGAGRPNAPVSSNCPKRGPRCSVGPALPAQRGGADLVPDGRTDVAGAVGLLGHDVHDLRHAHAAAV
jgi:TRAP transporter 4TM/12TM fusion protein